jgi:predicted PurR-regulated permease PerM
MLAGRRRIGDKVALIAASVREDQRIRTITDRIAANIRGYIWIQALTGAMRTACAAAVFLAVGLDNSLFWVVAFFVLTFIPELGVTIGSIVAALFALVQFPTVWQALVIFGGIQLSAFIIGNFIYPRMQAKAQNIDPIATILGLSFWTLLWGLPGAFLAVPMTIMLMLVLAQFDSTRWVAALLSNDGNTEDEQKLQS